MRELLVLVALVASVVTAQAQATTAPGTVTLVRTGWNGEAFGIMINAPQLNPASCPNGAAGYVSDSNQPGYHTYYAAALTGYASRRPVNIVVSNTECVGGFPKIIGINLP